MCVTRIVKNLFCDEEFALLYDTYKQSNREYSYNIYEFDLDSLNDDECLSELRFRFRKKDIHEISRSQFRRRNSHRKRINCPNLIKSHARTRISINVLTKRWNGTFNVLFQRPERHLVERIARDMGPAIVLRLWRNLAIPFTFPSPLYVLLLKPPILLNVSDHC